MGQDARMDLAKAWVDLAQPRLGSEVVSASDEFFAAKERLIDPADPLFIPGKYDANDMRFATAQGFNTGEQFFTYLRDSFDVLYAEGQERPKMMSVGLHCRIVGRPGRFAALERFLRYAKEHKDVWFCRRIDIARHWRQTHPYNG